MVVLIDCCLLVLVAFSVPATVILRCLLRSETVDPGFIGRKIPAEISTMANPCSCLRNGCFALIDRNQLPISCTAEDWWNPSTEKGDLARKIERAYGRYSCTRFIVVAATYVCDGDAARFKRVTEETLTEVEGTAEMIEFAWESTKLKKCNLGDKPASVNWTTLIKNDAIISRPLAKLVARLIEKAKEDFAEKEVERVPFWTFCSNADDGVLPSLFAFVCKEYAKIKQV